MIYHFVKYFFPESAFFNIIHYVSFRAISALLTSLFVSFLYGERFLEQARYYFRSKSRENTPDNHRAKDAMPTMGGLFILLIVTATSLLWCNLTQPLVWIFLWNMLGFGIIGCIDDWSKIKRRGGISARNKLFLQLLVSACTASCLYGIGFSTAIVFPFFKYLQPDIGLFFIPWVMFVIVAMSNAVNLTDGLDGLAITSLIPNFATFSVLCYLAGHYTLAHYLHIPFACSAEVGIMGAILVGASLSFLWYNTYPAQIFMGDVGSLSLGASLACLALIGKQELLLLLAGGLFVAETVSVIVQVISFRYWGRRVFKMAPMHHHFELLGWQESKITVRFGIISLILCLCALITLKIR